MSQLIHPSAVISPSAIIADDVEIGAFCVIGDHVTIGSGTKIETHVVVKGPTVIGNDCHLFQFSTIGDATPDLKYQGEETWLRIGDRNVIREGVTIHRGTVQDRGETVIGNDNLIMAYAHIGHDCVVGNHTIFVNNASVSGHVIVGDWAILGGYSLVHQHVHIGTHSFVSFAAGVNMDVPAFVVAAGYRAEPKGINLEGLKRRGFSREEMSELTKSYKLLYRRKLKLDEALEQIRLINPDNPHISTLCSSIEASTRGIIR